MFLKKTIFVFLFLVSSAKLFSNVAMPGFWGNGSGVDFFPLFAEDSIYLGKIQMKSERIVVFLFPGYAVVKGTYKMYNSTNEEIQLTTGYPVNGNYSQRVVEYVHLNDLYELEVRVNGESKNTEKYSVERELNSAFKEYESSEWYIWKTTFAPLTTTEITVNFIVNTNDAVLRKGYDTKKGNAFTYVLETGKAWKDKIEGGTIEVYLQNGLKTSDIIGAIPENTFLMNDTLLYYHFENLEPSPENNIVIWYEKKTAIDSFSSITQMAQKYYAQIDAIPAADSLSATLHQKLAANNFSVSQLGSKAVGLLFILAIAAPFIIGGLILVLIIYFAVRYFKRKRKA